MIAATFLDRAKRIRVIRVESVEALFLRGAVPPGLVLERVEREI